MHSDPIAPVIFGVTAIVVFALLGRFAARRLGQPSVLGELLMGILLGNLFYYLGYDLIVVLREGTACIDIARAALSGLTWNEAASMVLGEDTEEFLEVLRGPNGGDYLEVAHAVDVFSRYGVIFLLFHVGLGTCVTALRRVGADSLRVALIGVVAPFVLGLFVSRLLNPGAEVFEHLFLGATLAATSIGITARVLRDLRQSYSPEAQIILGAAVLDDVLGLIILAVVSGIVVTGSLALGEVVRTVVLASLFLAGAFLLGPYFLKLLIWLLQRLDVHEAKLFISFVFVMVLAWTANLAGLATIVGAFAAGLLLLDSQFKHWGDFRQHKYTIKNLFAPIEAILVPIFFVLMGIQVKLETFLDWHVIGEALGLLAAAMLGKWLSGLGVRGGVKRSAVGVGMIPRGEVGLVFASIGKSLGVIHHGLFSAVVLMVVLTTVITPPLLKLTLGRSGEKDEKAAAELSKLCE